MEKERKIKTLSLVALIVAVLGLTVAFANLSKELTITGTAQVKGATWDIYFSNVSVATSGGATASNATISNKTTISIKDVTLTKPGDSVTYTFDVVNNGTVDAKISNIVNKTASFASLASTPSDSDVTIVKNGFTYKLTYNDGSNVSMNDTLAKSTTRTMKIVIKFDSTSVPTGDVSVTNLGSTITYVQS